MEFVEDEILNKLVEKSLGYESLNRVLSTFHLNLCRNFPHDNRSNLENVRDEVYNKLLDEDFEVAEMLISELNKIKCRCNFLKDEDFKLLCILLTKLRYPGGLHRIMKMQFPSFERKKLDLEEPIKRSLSESNPAKKAVMYMKLASNIFIYNFENKNLKQVAEEAVNSDMRRCEGTDKIKNYIYSNDKIMLWDALITTLRLDNRPVAKAKILAYIASELPYLRITYINEYYYNRSKYEGDKEKHKLRDKTSMHDIKKCAIEKQDPSEIANLLRDAGKKIPYSRKEGLLEDLETDVKNELKENKKFEIKNDIIDNIHIKCWDNLRRSIKRYDKSIDDNLKTLLWLIVAKNHSESNVKLDALYSAFNTAPKKSAYIYKYVTGCDNLRMAIDVATTFKDSSKRDEILNKIISREDLWIMAFDEAMGINDESEKIKALLSIISVDNLRVLALREAESIDDPFVRTKMMIQAASNLPHPLRENGLERALLLLIQEENPMNDEKRYLKSKTLVEIAPRLPDNLRQHAIADALKSANAIQDNYYRSKALVEIAPLLPDPLKEELLKKARETIRGTDSNLFEMDIEYIS